LFTSITSNSTLSHSLTISVTFTTLVAASFEMWIIQDFPLNSTIAQVQSIILATLQIPLYQTSGSQTIVFISSIALFHQIWSFAVTVVFQSSAIDILTQYSFSIL
jgi:hypothetical protein